jgi:hypothetical protein
LSYVDSTPLRYGSSALEPTWAYITGVRCERSVRGFGSARGCSKAMIRTATFFVHPVETSLLELEAFGNNSEVNMRTRRLNIPEFHHSLGLRRQRYPVDNRIRIRLSTGISDREESPWIRFSIGISGRVEPPGYGFQSVYPVGGATWIRFSTGTSGRAEPPGYGSNMYLRPAGRFLIGISGQRNYLDTVFNRYIWSAEIPGYGF